MSEKKSNGINISVFFILVLIIIVGAMVFVIYKLNAERNYAIEIAQSSNKQIEDLRIKFDKLQRKVNIILDTMNISENTVESSDGDTSETN